MHIYGEVDVIELSTCPGKTACVKFMMGVSMRFMMKSSRATKKMPYMARSK